MLPTTTHRVSLNTAPCVNERIRARTLRSIAYHADAGPEAITRRIAELDREWDIERTLERNAAIASLTGLTLGLTVNRKWLFLPAAVGFFLLQHATQGWCPPIPVLRRMGVRTAAEIDEERTALKALRGDFVEIGALANASDSAEHALRAARY